MFRRQSILFRQFITDTLWKHRVPTESKLSNKIQERKCMLLLSVNKHKTKRLLENVENSIVCKFISYTTPKKGVRLCVCVFVLPSPSVRFRQPDVFRTLSSNCFWSISVLLQMEAWRRSFYLFFFLCLFLDYTCKAIQNIQRGSQGARRPPLLPSFTNFVPLKWTWLRGRNWLCNVEQPSHSWMRRMILVILVHWYAHLPASVRVRGREREKGNATGSRCYITVLQFTRRGGDVVKHWTQLFSSTKFVQHQRRPS